MQAFANYILSGRFQAILVVIVTALLSLTGVLFPLSLISGAALALVTLRLGAVQGLTVVAYSSLPFVALSLGLFNDLRLAGEVVLTFWLPVLVLAELLRRTASLSATVGIGAGFVILYIALVYLVGGDPVPSWTERLNALFVALAGSEQAKEPQIQEFISRLAPMMTGGQAMSVLVMAITGLFIGRWWQAKLFNPGGLRQEFHGFRLGRWFAWPALVILLGMSLSLHGSGGLLGQMALEMSMVVLTLYMLQGLAVAHAVVALTRSNVGWLVALYVFMIVPQISMMVVMTGLVDSWLDIRARVKRARNE